MFHGETAAVDKLRLCPRASRQIGLEWLCLRTSCSCAHGPACTVQLCPRTSCSCAQGPAVVSGIALSTDKLQLCPRASLSGLHLLCLRTSCSYAYGLVTLARHVWRTSCVYGPAESTDQPRLRLRASGVCVSGMALPTNQRGLYLQLLASSHSSSSSLSS